MCGREIGAILQECFGAWVVLLEIPPQVSSILSAVGFVSISDTDVNVYMAYLPSQDLH